MPLSLVEAMGAFYRDVLGLDADAGRWHPRVPGFS